MRSTERAAHRTSGGGNSSRDRDRQSLTGAAAARLIRCAIYTRKSTEEGLEQAFNSLDAQREACAAYIASQRHEEWVQVTDFYDDGGFSGGNMERPGLKQLMADVQAGKVDVIVVYKVDRLTRALSDFAKIVEVLDRAGASFVSVTQSFNTTTSMGRLTLNVLLSFAQFEREVTGERIRDKIAASKKKGMWMGGPVPLGYDVKDRLLVVNPAEAETVRQIFERYKLLGSIAATVTDLERSGIKTKRTQSSTGAPRGGIAWTRGGLAHFLTNRVYIGEVRHRDQHYPGAHAAIVSAELWDAVSAQLASNRLDRLSDRNISHGHLLNRILHDGLGRRMQGTQTNRGARRYHYYATNPTDAAVTKGASWRVPAGETKSLIVARLQAFMRDDAAVADAIASRRFNAEQLQSVIDGCSKRARELDRDIAGVVALVRRADLHDDRIELELDLGALINASVRGSVSEQHLHQLTIPVSRLRRGKDVRLVVGVGAGSIASAADPALIRLLASARSAWSAMLAAGQTPIDDVARSQNYSRDHFRLLLRLATLSPSIVGAIVDGRQPVGLNRQKLATVHNQPIDWAEQRAALGFA